MSFFKQNPSSGTFSFLTSSSKKEDSTLTQPTSTSTTSTSSNSTTTVPNTPTAPSIGSAPLKSSPPSTSSTNNSNSPTSLSSSSSLSTPSSHSISTTSDSATKSSLSSKINTESAFSSTKSGKYVSSSSNSNAAGRSSKKSESNNVSAAEMQALLDTLQNVYSTKNRMLLQQDFINTSDIMHEKETIEHEISILKETEADSLDLTSYSEKSKRSNRNFSSKSDSLTSKGTTESTRGVALIGGSPVFSSRVGSLSRTSVRSFSSPSNRQSSEIFEIGGERCIEEYNDDLYVVGNYDLKSNKDQKGKIECSVIEVDFDEVYGNFQKEEELRMDVEKKKENNTAIAEGADLRQTVDDDKPAISTAIQSHQDISALKNGDVWVDESKPLINQTSSAFMGAQVTWAFKHDKSSNSSLNIQDIQKFCFPSGIYINFFSRQKAIASLIKDGERHVMNFPNAEGGSCFACCYIVNTITPSNSIKMTKYLMNIVKKQKSAKKIVKQVREFIARMKKRRWEVPVSGYRESYSVKESNLDSSSHSAGGGTNNGDSSHGMSSKSQPSSDVPKKSFFDLTFSNSNSTTNNSSNSANNNSINSSNSSSTKSVNGSNNKDNSSEKKDESFFSKVFRRNANNKESVVPGFHPIDISNLPVIEEHEDDRLTINITDKGNDHSVSGSCTPNSEPNSLSLNESNSAPTSESVDSLIPPKKPPRKSISISRSNNSDSGSTILSNDQSNNSNNSSEAANNSGTSVEALSPDTNQLQPSPKNSSIDDSFALQGESPISNLSIDDLDESGSDASWNEEPQVTIKEELKEIPWILRGMLPESYPADTAKAEGSKDNSSTEPIAEDITPRGRCRVLWDENMADDDINLPVDSNDDDAENLNDSDSKKLRVMEQVRQYEKQDHYEIIAALQHQKYCILSKRAYCIVTKDPNHSKVFKILEAMANAERALLISRLSDNSQKPENVLTQSINNRSGNNFCKSTEIVSSEESLSNSPMDSSCSSVNQDGQDSNTIAPADIAKKNDSFDRYRSIFLEACNTSLGSNHFTNKIAAIPSLASSISKTAGTTIISVPGFIENFELLPDCEYPSMAEWTTAVMMIYIAPDKIKTILKILLCERSIIIWGKNPGVVSAVSIAVSMLMSPFAWEGAFIPLVPDDAREVFEAPFPFIVGTISAPNLSLIGEHVAVLTIDEDFAAVNVTSRYTAWFSRLPDVSMDMHHDPLFENKLRLCRDKVLNGVAKRFANGLDNCVNPVDMFLSSMDAIEKKYVKKFSEICIQTNKRYCGNLEKHGNWKSCAKAITSDPSQTGIDSARGNGGKQVSYQFEPNLFLEPQICHLDFLNVISRTKYFQVYFEKKAYSDCCFEESSLEFIKDWLTYRIKKRRNLKGKDNK